MGEELSFLLCILLFSFHEMFEFVEITEINLPRKIIGELPMQRKINFKIAK